MVADCPAEYEKILWLFRELAAPDQAQVAAHIDSCPRCVEDVGSLRRTAELLAAREGAAQPQGDAACLDEAELAAWVDGALDPEAEASALSHLARCARCRRAAASLIRTLRSALVTPAVRALEKVDVPERGSLGRPLGLPRRARVAAIAAAIAAVLAGVLFLRPTDLEFEETPAHREAIPGAISLPQPIAPVGELEAVDAFTWSLINGADLYRVTVFDVEGTVIWEAETEEARLTPPTTVQFETGSQYFWKVVARMGWDRWLDSELVAFTISKR